MNVDKRNGSVCFSEKEHIYWNDQDNGKYISVTTLIGQFSRPFEKDFWSSYKALEKLIPKDNWNIEKKSLLNTKTFNKEILSLYDISDETFQNTKQEILKEWDDKNKQACERGTKIHAKLENSMYENSNNISLKKYGVGGKFICKKDRTELDIPYGVYPEYLISYESKDGLLRLAGQIDLLVKSGNDITIIDYKTNEKIDKKSGFNTVTKSNVKMLYPLNTLMDCNYSHYEMQLSTYAWMVEKLNPNFTIKDLILVHFDHNGNQTIYNVDYLKNEVKDMLTYYKLKVKQKRQRDLMEPIKY